MTITKNLQGLRVFIIEDEALISMLVEDTLSDIGCQSAGIATSVEEALHQVSTLSCDAVVMDVNLHGERTFPVAELLTEKHIPFIFTTGYGADGIPENFRHVPVLQKPFQDHELAAILSDALNGKTA